MSPEPAPEDRREGGDGDRVAMETGRERLRAEERSWRQRLDYIVKSGLNYVTGGEA